MKMWQQGGDARQRLSPGLHMTDAAAAGALTLLVTNPVWVAKTQVMLAYSAHASERTALRPEQTKVPIHLLTQHTTHARVTYFVLVLLLALVRVCVYVFPCSCAQFLHVLARLWRTEHMRGLYKVCRRALLLSSPLPSSCWAWALPHTITPPVRLYQWRVLRG